MSKNQTKQIIRYSKFLSLVLRHRPEQIGIALDSQGWVGIDTLLAAANQHGVALNRESLETVVTENNKQRFRISDDGQRIRASQGHSVQIDLQLEPVTPPDTLYHGTAQRFLDSIRASGLQSRNRQHVHLSADEQTATNVGQRHGKPVVLIINAGTMAEDGIVFYRSDNGVWLTDAVPIRYIQFPT
ncbi:MAG: RNA 2'-phosphotransferase [Chloroflexota bacterium]